MKINPIHLWTLLIAALLIRLLSLGTYPLMDTTEARYGEMARLMVETGNWLTPQFDYGVPFWGKPPLFTWMSASGIELLGVNEFAVRTPHWLAGVLVIVLMAWFARRQGYDALVTALVLATCGLFSIAAGAVTRSAAAIRPRRKIMDGALWKLEFGRRNFLAAHGYFKADRH